MKRNDITTKGWEAYKLIDSGEGRKLEQFGAMIVDRPDPQALWEKKDQEQWLKAQAQFVWAEKGDRWSIASNTPEEWHITWHDMILQLSLKGFKHIGIFPEHASQWAELQKLGNEQKGLRMLNLFGYTGAASIAASQTGIQVTHVDASKQAMETVKENIELSNLLPTAMRLITEDALKYAKRLVQREEQFEIIIMDPPAFGRGPKGEVWKIEESLAELVTLLPKLLSPEATLVIMNGYAAGYAARTFAELLHEALPTGTIEYGEMAIAQENSERVLPTGIYATWRKKS